MWGECWQLTRGATAGSKVWHKADAASALAPAWATLLIDYGRQEVSLKNFVTFHTQSLIFPCELKRDSSLDLGHRGISSLKQQTLQKTSCGYPQLTFQFLIYCSASGKVESVQSQMFSDVSLKPFWMLHEVILLLMTLNRKSTKREARFLYDNSVQWGCSDCSSSWVWVSIANCEVCITGPWFALGTVDTGSNQYFDLP